uniref:Torsin-1A C-terminal domain-containing protein n=1 Tax=Globodera rostochiensis TaxID=31243 RepID=A0A914GWE8_GLORO
MRGIRFLLLSLLFYSPYFFISCGAELVSLTVGVSAFSALGLFIGDFGGLYTLTKCKFYECCDRPWINRDVALRLEPDVEERLYGQHIAQNTVIKALKAHLAKSLGYVLSRLDGLGQELSGEDDRRSHLQESNAKSIRPPIRGHPSLPKCGGNGQIQRAASHLDSNQFVEFNGGANSIAQRALEYYNRGKSREEIAFREMEEIIQISAYNEGEGGLKSSRLINKHLIDYFVPFLPLERKHIVMCFKDYLRSLNVNYTPEQLERLVDSISYFPRETPIYASAGCKQVVQRTDFMLDDLIRESRLAINNYSDEL